MRRVRAPVLFLFAAILLSSVAACLSDVGESERKRPPSQQGPEETAASIVGAPRRAVGALSAAGRVDALEPQAGGLHPVVAARAAWNVADVVLPLRAFGATRLTDRATGMTITFALDGTGSADAKLEDGFVIYRDALGPGQHVVHDVTEQGTEDFVVLSRPAELRYRVELRAGVAGLRLVANTVEFLDTDGAPRLRMAPPWLVDSSGETHELSVGIDGCAVDTNPEAPWGRGVVATANECTIRVSPPAGVVGGVVVDPSWQTTGAMHAARESHTVDVLSTGYVLAVGGFDSGSAMQATCELFDPSSGTWAVTGSLKSARANHKSALLPSGKLLTVGGNNSALNTAELYDPSSGTWGSCPQPAVIRSQHSMTLLQSGKVLVAGGENRGTATNSTELFDPSAGWSNGGTLSYARYGHTATLLQNGQVLIAGGYSTKVLAQVELFNEADGWTLIAPLAQARWGHTAGIGPDGRVVVAGGSGLAGFLGSAETYDNDTGQWSQAPTLPNPFHFATSVGLGNGCVVVAGGGDNGDHYFTDVNAFDFRTNKWNKLSPMAVGRLSHAACEIDAARVLVSGGVVAAGGATTSAEELTLNANGQACTQTCDCASGLCVAGMCCEGTKTNGSVCSNECECKSGFCVDGICCNKACDGLCETCSASGGGSGSDGTCGPVAKGKDPRGDCKAEGVSTCGTTGVCDGNRACEQYKEATECRPPACQGHELVTSNCKGGQCSSSSADCSPFACSEAPPACLTSCKNISDCAKGFVCTADHQCIPTPENNPDTDVNGCCGVAGRGPEQPWFVALLPAAIALAFARRRTRRA